MNIRLGVYDIFSRIIPGGLYIIAIGQFLTIVGLVRIDSQIIYNLSIVEYIVFIVAGYIVGEIFDRFTLIWFRLFAKKGFSARSFAAFREQHKDYWNIDFGNSDWRTLSAFIRTRDNELSSELDRYNALSIMLRDISFAFLLLMVNQYILFFISWHYVNLVFAVLLFVLSILIIQESVKFRSWFYGFLYETVLAYRIDLEKSIKPIRRTAKQSKKERMG